ncbi:hypothetical protein O9929_16750 [Vibrio lentus]|nr:hypothetical protein [Vibrio lentus]
MKSEVDEVFKGGGIEDICKVFLYALLNTLRSCTSACLHGDLEPA